MKILTIWIFFGQLLHQDFLEEHPDLITGIELIYENFSEQQKREFTAFLKEVKKRNPNDEQLYKLWLKSKSDIYIPPKNIRKFYEELYMIVEVIPRKQNKQ